MRLSWSRVGSFSSIIGFLIKRRNLGTDIHTGGMPWKGRNLGDASISQGMPKITRKLPEDRREARIKFFSPYAQLIIGLLASRTMRQYIFSMCVCFWSSQSLVIGTLLWQPKQIKIVHWEELTSTKIMCWECKVESGNELPLALLCSGVNKTPP